MGLVRCDCWYGLLFVGPKVVCSSVVCMVVVAMDAVVVAIAMGRGLVLDMLLGKFFVAALLGDGSLVRKLLVVVVCRHGDLLM